MAAARRRVGDSVSIEAARRIALAAQGFAEGRPSGRVDVRHLRRVVDRVGALQIDAVNVLCRSHYLPVFARLGPYSRTTLDRMAWGDEHRELFEYTWGHKAALLPLRAHRLMRWRMDTVARQAWDAPIAPDLEAPWSVIVGMQRLSKERPGFVDDVLAVITDRGPVTAAEANPDGQRRLPTDPDPDPSTGRMWNWQDAKIAVEYLFSTGRVSVAGRRNFERLYDLSERVLPADSLTEPVIGPDEAQRELIRVAARAQGIASLRELCGVTSNAGYFPMPRDIASRRVAELVEAGDLVPVRVEDSRAEHYLWREAREPGAVAARALLSPFDSLIWNRDRTLRLFDFHYRISIYTPASQRTDGYYVLPFLLGDRLVARVDLKADRKTARLVVPVAHVEPGADPREAAAELAAELQLMARWLELDHVVVEGRGDLGPALTRAVGSRRA